jgi:lipopolysaccharide export system permease protein
MSTGSTKQISLIVSRYLITAVLPYFGFAWLLLTVILFVQQASRYSDIFFNANVPGTLVWQLAFALLPNVIAFTCPMAVLVGTIIGLAKMQGDSELVAIRAAGVGNMQIAVPILLLGLILSGFAFLVNSRGVPLAATLVRNVALQTAIKKLESPIEPGTFNSDVAGYTIYVQDGNVETGRWENIFIFRDDRPNNAVRLITSSSGRIDSTEETSELVLENATSTTLPSTPGAGKYVTETIGDVRLAIKTSRGEMIKRLSSRELTPEELGLGALSDYASASERTERERIEAQLLQQRRVLLSITPLIFCLLGTVIVLRLNRGGRGFGVALALLVLVVYYLLAFVGEQLARTSYIPVLAAGSLPLIGSAAAFVWFSVSGRMAWASTAAERVRSLAAVAGAKANKLRTRDLFLDVTTGIRDFDLVRDLCKNFLLTLLFITAIFIIFTAFEMWKFAGVIEGGVWLLSKYLIYLLPFVYLQVAPSAAMVAILATYVVKSRQNEIVTWTSAGQSAYRLLLPSLLLAALLGGADLLVQETVLPRANQMQDAVRMQIRNNGVAVSDGSIRWVAEGRDLLSFRSASDNEKRHAACGNCLIDVSLYRLGTEGKLQAVYRASAGRWQDGRLIFDGPVEKDIVGDGHVTPSSEMGGEVAFAGDPFASAKEKPTHVDTSGLKKQLASTESASEQRGLEVSIQRKYSTAFLPLVIALFTAPFSLSLSRKGKAATVGYAVGLWLLFTGTSSLFEQLGLSGQLTPTIAVWSPLAIFAFLGVYLLTKVRT